MVSFLFKRVTEYQNRGIMSSHAQPGDCSAYNKEMAPLSFKRVTEH